MLDPITNATALSQIMSQVANNGDLLDSRTLIDPVERAHNILHNAANNDADHLSKERSECLATICELQHQLILTVTDEIFSAKLLPLLIGHIEHVVKARSKQELDITSMALARIGNAIAAYNNLKKRRRIIRLIAVIISVLSLVGIGMFLYMTDHDEKAIIPILMLPLPVLLWSVIGSFAAILYRFTNALDRELNDPLRWLFSRPLTGVILGTIAYLVLKVGFLTTQPGTKLSDDALGSAPIMWLIAFIASFSDRFSDFLLTTIVGKFGGNKEDDLMKEVQTSTTKTDATIVHTADSILANLGKRSNQTEVTAGKKGIINDLNGLATNGNNPSILETQQVEHKNITVSTRNRHKKR